MQRFIAVLFFASLCLFANAQYGHGGYGYENNQVSTGVYAKILSGELTGFGRLGGYNPVISNHGDQQLATAIINIINRLLENISPEYSTIITKIRSLKNSNQILEINEITAKTLAVIAAIHAAEVEIRSLYVGGDITDYKPSNAHQQINVPSECTPPVLNPGKKFSLVSTGIGELGYLTYNVMQLIINTFRENRISLPSPIIRMRAEANSYGTNKVSWAISSLEAPIRCTATSSPELSALYANQSIKYQDMFYENLLAHYNELNTQINENSADPGFCRRAQSDGVVLSTIRLRENIEYYVHTIPNNLSRELPRDLATVQVFNRLHSLSLAQLNRCVANNKQ